MELREPKRKRVGAHIKPQQPFPIVIESENGIPAKSELWPVYIGNFTGDIVVVSNPEEMTSLYTMGFFGKGSFSRGYPSFGLSKKGIPPVIKERQWKRRKSWMESMKKNVGVLLPKNSDQSMPADSGSVNTNNENEVKDVMDMHVDGEQNIQGSDNKLVNILELNRDLIKTDMSEDDSGTQSENLLNKVLVLADSDDEDIEKVIRDPQPHLEDEPIKTAVETLNLTLEEAFFLSYGLGCLHVMDISGQPLKIKQLWQTFCNAKTDFIELYIAYHYFRAKGWVVKTGYKFGGDFLLYKQGPPFYHASFIVLVERVNSRLERQKESLTWKKLHGLNRLSEGSGKYCYSLCSDPEYITFHNEAVLLFDFRTWPILKLPCVYCEALRSSPGQLVHYKDWLCRDQCMQNWDIIVCQVIFPDSLTTEDLETPKTLPRFQVNELMIKRWISSQEREDKEDIQD